MLKLMARSIFSLEAIYELRKAPIIMTLFVALMIGVLHFTPHSVAFMTQAPYIRHVEQLWGMTPEYRIDMINALPTDCAIVDRYLNCDTVINTSIHDNLSVLVNVDDKTLQNGLILMEDHFTFVGYGVRESFSYYLFEGTIFADVQQNPYGYDFLMVQLSQLLRPIWIIPFITNSYMTGIVSYVIYIFIISILSMLMKVGQTSFPSYKEVLNILVFSSMGPVFAMVLIGFALPGFTNLIFNLITPVVAWGVYKRHVIPALNDPNNTDIKEKDFKGVA